MYFVPMIWHRRSAIASGIGIDGNIGHLAELCPDQQTEDVMHRNGDGIIVHKCNWFCGAIVIGGRSRAESAGLHGQPWTMTSFWRKTSSVPSSLKMKTLFPALYGESKIGRSLSDDGCNIAVTARARSMSHMLE
eukprot:6719946-Ditylum_brightwellii.AAC.1